MVKSENIFSLFFSNFYSFIFTVSPGLVHGVCRAICRNSGCEVVMHPVHHCSNCCSNNGSKHFLDMMLLENNELQGGNFALHGAASHNHVTAYYPISASHVVF